MNKHSGKENHILTLDPDSLQINWLIKLKQIKSKKILILLLMP